MFTQPFASEAVVAQAFAIAVLLCGTMLLGAGQSTERTVWNGIYTEDQAERGSTIYRRTCRKCHFADLSGAGDADTAPGELPPGLVGSAFFDRWNDLTVAELYLAIARGMPGDRPGTLRPQATADVLSYLLQQNAFPAGDAELPPEPARLEVWLITEFR
mgnify:FL=1